MSYDRVIALIKLRKRGEDGRFEPMVSGQESDEEMRNLILEFSRHKVDCCAAPHCPLRMMGGLSESTLKEVLDRLTRDDLLTLFEMERKIHDQH